MMKAISKAHDAGEKYHPLSDFEAQIAIALIIVGYRLDLDSVPDSNLVVDEAGRASPKEMAPGGTRTYSQVSGGECLLSDKGSLTCNPVAGRYRRPRG